MKLNAELKRGRQQDEDVTVRGGRIIPSPAVTHGGQGNRNLIAGAPSVNVNTLRPPPLASVRLSVLFFNARSILNKIVELHILVNEVKPDVLIMVETWLSNQFESLQLGLLDYTLIQSTEKTDQMELSHMVEY